MVTWTEEVRWIQNERLRLISVNNERYITHLLTRRELLSLLLLLRIQYERGRGGRKYNGSGAVSGPD